MKLSFIISIFNQDLQNFDEGLQEKWINHEFSHRIVKFLPSISQWCSFENQNDPIYEVNDLFLACCFTNYNIKIPSCSGLPVSNLPLRWALKWGKYSMNF